jgi:hypothetical protein
MPRMVSRPMIRKTPILTMLPAPEVAVVYPCWTKLGMRLTIPPKMMIEIPLPMPF